MPKFSRSGKGKMPAISTASLPDIVFMLLFFFMVTTVMREVSLKVENRMPFADQVKKLENRALVSFIYIGKPTDKEEIKKYAPNPPPPKIQLNDSYKETDQIREYIASEREQLMESERNKLTVSLKVDENIEMGIVTDVKQELRKASALKINYSTRKGQVEF